VESIFLLFAFWSQMYIASKSNAALRLIVLLQMFVSPCCF